MAEQNTISLKLALSGLQQVEAGLQRVTGALNSIKGAALGGAGALLAFTGLSKIEGSIEKVVQLGSELTRLKVQTGATIPQLLVIRKILKESGGEAGDAATLINKMQRSIAEAAAEGGESERAFARLNLSVETLAQAGPAEQLRLIGERINGLENPAERVATAMAIFGRSGASLLPTFARGLESLRHDAGAFGEVMERNSHAFHELEVVVGRAKSSGTKFFAGVLDLLPVEEITHAINGLLKAIDFTALGQRAGAFVAVAIDQWQQGRFGEFIALTIQAGFELGEIAARKVWTGLADFLGSETFLKPLANNLLTTINEIAKVIGNVITFLVQLLGTVMLKFQSEQEHLFAELWETLKAGFTVVVNFFAEQLERVINRAITAANKLPGVNLSTVNLGRATDASGSTAPALTWTEAWRTMADAGEGARATIREFLDASTQAGRELLGLNQQIFTGESAALKELLALTDEQLKKRAALAEAAKKEMAVQQSFLPTANLIKQLREQEIAARQKLVDLDNRRAAIDSDFTRTEAEKWAQRKALLLEERAIQQGIVDLLRRRATLPGLGEPERTQLEGQATSAEGRVIQTQRAIGGLGADPRSFSEQWSAAITGLRDQFGTLAQNIGQTFTSVIGAAVESISNGITGLIVGTLTWGQALQQIGTSILTSVIQGIVQMGVRWVATQLLMAFSGKAILAAATAATIPFAAAQSAIWAVPATLATISSYGAAAIAAPGLIALAEGLVKVQSVFGSFARGGYTGAGGRSEVAGVVHRREFVFDADSTSRIGVPALEALRHGEPVPAVGGAVTVQGHSMKNNVVIVRDRSELREFLKSAEGRAEVLEIINSSKLELGLG
ncbi:MAG TPA: hypothetical protein VGQ71_01175 [Terriglobales bacterium]|nr:hypothetical protein [Terriglobales bacterium]